jgi:hypothetical protein
MQQPSAQGIASLYRGNPQPLQQSIQKDQKARPGLPPDLQKMLALQIVNNEKDGFAAQKAMEQLQQMSGGMGKPPTVMQSLEQQAQQKLQAQAMQAQQQQQGLQALAQQAPAGPVPAGTPQPEVQPQPQGLDQSDRVAFAGAEGGIVAFADGGESEYETPYDRMNRKNREEAEARDTPESRKDSEGIMKALKFAGGLPIEALKHLVSAPGYGLSRLMDGEAAPKAAPAAPAAPAESNRAMLNKADAAVRSAPPEAPVQSPIAKDLAQLAQQKAAPVAAPRPAAMAPAVPAAPAAPSDAMNVLMRRMKEDPAAREAAETAKYAAAVGAPDTTQHDRLIAELEKRKRQLEPKQGFEGLMEYLGQVSRADVRGRGSFASGAAGAARLEDLNKERQLQQFELSKQAIEVSQKKLDTVRSFAKDQYNVGKSAFDQVYKDQHDAAKEVVKDEQAAKQLAQQNTLKILEMQNQKEVAGIHAGATLAAAKERAAGAGGGDKQQLNELKALQTSLKDQLKTTFNKAERQQLQAQLDKVNMAVAQMAGLDTMGGAPGAASPGGTRPPLSSFQR